MLPCLLLTIGTLAADAPVTPSAKDALRPLHDLIGTWRGTGEPAGSREEKRLGFWSETIRWEWRFKGADAWLVAVIDKGKHFKSAELRWLPERGAYRLTVRGADGKDQVYTGTLEKRRLTLDQEADPTKPGRRVVVSLLHANRYLYRVDARPAGKPSFATVFQVGCTKEGVAFAAGDGAPVCIVSGGRGTMPVTHKGKTYYVCCSGCRDAFEEEPDKYVKAFEAKE